MTRRYLFSAGVAGQHSSPSGTQTDPVSQTSTVVVHQRILVLGTLGCHLCEQALKGLRLALQGRCDVEYLDIAECQNAADSDVLIAAFGEIIPVMILPAALAPYFSAEKITDAVKRVIVENTAFEPKYKEVNSEALFYASGIASSRLSDQLAHCFDHLTV